MNFKNNYVGELQEFEIATGHGVPMYIKCQTPVGNHGVQLMFTSTVRLSSGAAYSSTKAYAKYGHAKADAAYMALCAERAVRRKDTPDLLSSNKVIEACRAATSVPKERTLYMSPSVPLRTLMARVLALETVPETRARVVWQASDFDTMARFSAALRSLGIYHAHRASLLNEFDIFC